MLHDSIIESRRESRAWKTLPCGRTGSRFATICKAVGWLMFLLPSGDIHPFAVKRVSGQKNFERTAKNIIEKRSNNFNVCLCFGPTCFDFVEISSKPFTKHCVTSYFEVLLFERLKKSHKVVSRWFIKFNGCDSEFDGEYEAAHSTDTDPGLTADRCTQNYMRTCWASMLKRLTWGNSRRFCFPLAKRNNAFKQTPRQ